MWIRETLNEKAGKDLQICLRKGSDDTVKRIKEIMKTVGSYILLFAGMVLVAGFGSEITATILPSNSWLSHALLPGYTVGLFSVCAFMFTRLNSQD
jgi:hypothetical protein